MYMLVWLAILIFLLVVEACTVNLVTIWFAGGALAATIAAYLDLDLVTQLLVFILVSIILLVITRPAVLKYMEKTKTKTNIDSLIGRTAVVTEEINNLQQTGKILINDIDWMARTNSNNFCIKPGTVVRIREVKGAHLIVEETSETLD